MSGAGARSCEVEDRTTRVLLVDDHALIRAGLRSLMTSTRDLQVVGEAANGEEAVRLAAELTPDVVVMDLSMPVMDGVTATRLLLERCPSAKVLVLTTFSDQAIIATALAAGAVGYVYKDAEPRTVLAEIRCTRVAA